MTDQKAGGDLFNYVCLVALSICLGSTFFFQSFALQDMSAALAGSLRLIFCAAVLVPVSLIAGHGLPATQKGWNWAAFNGLIGFFLPFQLSIWALQFITTSLAAVIYSVIPLLVLALSRLFLGVPISPRKWAGLLLGTVGLVILVLSNSQGGSLLEGGLIAKFAMVGAAILLAIASIAIRKMPPGSPLAGSAAASLVAGALSLPLVVVFAPSHWPSLTAIAAIAAAGIVSTALGQALRFFLVRRRGPVFIAPNAYMAAMFATLLGIVLLGEPFTASLALGFAVILLGLLVAQDGTGGMQRV